MTWGRGLLRLWIVLSVMWTASMFVALRPDEAYRDYLAAQNALGDDDGLYSRDDILRAAEKAASANDANAAKRLRDLAEEVAESPDQVHRSAERKQLERATRELKGSAAFVLVPILLTFAIGTALLWALRGFRGDTK